MTYLRILVQLSIAASMWTYAVALFGQAAATKHVITPDQSVADCRRLESISAKLQTASGKPSPAGQIVRDTQQACAEFKAGQLSHGSFLDRLEKLETRAVFVDIPDVLRSSIPFNHVQVFTGFTSYTLFLFPSEEWKSRNEDVKTLYKHFQAFGEALGEKRLAIWFSGEKDSPDVVRSKFYCDQLGLNYNDGPYVVTVGKHPALLHPADRAVVVSLSGISVERAVRVLNVLERDLRRNRNIAGRALVFAEIQERMLTAVDRNADVLKDIGIRVLSLK